MEIQSTTTLSEAQKKELLVLWNTEYPRNLNHANVKSLNGYLESLEVPHHVLIVNDKGLIKGWFVDFYRDDAKWFAMIIHGDLQGKGHGSLLLEKAKENCYALNGWVIDAKDYKKIDNSEYRSPLEFYKKNGFKVIKETRLELETFSAVKIEWVNKA